MVKRFEDVKKFQDMEGAKKWAEEFMQDIFSRSQEILMKQSFDSGFLLRSGKPPFWEGPDHLAIEYDAPYALFIEYGTDPHPMSGHKLVGWVRRKLGIKGDHAMKVAWAIANKIRKHGTDPKPFLRPAINEIINKEGLDIQPVHI